MRQPRWLGRLRKQLDCQRSKNDETPTSGCRRGPRFRFVLVSAVYPNATSGAHSDRYERPVRVHSTVLVRLKLVNRLNTSHTHKQKASRRAGDRVVSNPNEAQVGSQGLFSSGCSFCPRPLSAFCIPILWTDERLSRKMHDPRKKLVRLRSTGLAGSSAIG